MDLLDQQRLAALHGNYQMGEAIGLLLEKQDPADHRAAFNRGWYRMAAGDLLGGFELMERGRIAQPQIWGNLPLSRPDLPMWDGTTELGNRVILLNMEAGYGDQFLYVRFAGTLQKRYPNARIWIQCNSSIGAVLKTAPAIQRVIRPDEVLPPMACQYWFPIMRLPLALGITYATLDKKPYLSSQPADILRRNGRKRIGLRWWSNPGVWERIFPPRLMLELTKQFPEIEFYSFQMGPGKEFETGYPIEDLEPELCKGWSATASYLAAMDLVISSCTAVAHLSAAMGRPTWVVTPLLAWYPWGHGEQYSKWYENCRIFRQKKFMEWEVPFKEVSTCLSSI